MDIQEPSIAPGDLLRRARAGVLVWAKQRTFPVPYL